MARAKKATNILELQGAFKKNPQRENKNEPVVTSPFPEHPPDRLKPKEKEAWMEIVKEAPAGVLTSADVKKVEIVSVLWAAFLKDGYQMPCAYITRLTTELNNLGLSPNGRAGLTVEKPNDGANEFE